jgi:hypothetical protein
MYKTRPISILNINRKGGHESIKSNHQQIGVVDGDCPSSEQFLITVSHWIHWI